MKTALVTIVLTAILNCLPAHAVPITDFVTVGGKDWAQVADFTNLHWTGINQVCPSNSGGVCEDGKLNNFDMEGWTWASANEVNSLFNVFLLDGGVPVGELLGPGADRRNELDSTWAPDFTATFAPTFDEPIARQVRGYIRDDPRSLCSGVGIACSSANITDRIDQPGAGDLADTRSVSLETTPSDGYGGWFSREAVSVPAPSTLFLLGLSLLGLGASHKRAI